MNHDQPLRPANMIQIVALNQGRGAAAKPGQFAPLKPAEFLRLKDEGHLVLDTRGVPDFGAAHIPGALNVQQVFAEFEQRVGWLVPESKGILLVSEHVEAATAAMAKLAFVGLDRRVLGYLSGGMSAWINSAGLPTASLPQISAREAQQAIQDGMKLLDVRDVAERDDAHIEGSVFMNFKHLPGRAAELGLQPDDTIAVYCAGGFRANTAGSILLQEGYKNVVNLTGGIAAWKAAGLPFLDSDGQLCRI
jgi:hydroxyacylglutathione hydrolase